ncbi:hypothetical protein GV794_14455 [Nocardia cyriacigeorgica]|uniref:Alpha/beta hydrolase n=1 Tax=Nocardia cyriacigeorgica TaxID=135487 RepID=A0ABX0CJZ5_9NOCA|nr:hypothetical protein [Nocardia cyriacigeorgica]NEW38765.1 hypothetical protein [Nocardia cyriacigeorgica]NEW56846.1 hypothetical protein [Nocardia cyriacigeorgica]
MAEYGSHVVPSDLSHDDVQRGYARIERGILSEATPRSECPRTADYAIAYPPVCRKPYLLVNFHGMVTRPKYQPPIYGRFTSSAQLGAITVFVSDPVLRMHPESRIGWFLQAEPMSDDLLRLAVGIARRNDLAAIVWNGWSAGGYAAIRYAWRASSESMPSMAFAYAPQNYPPDLSWWGNYRSSLPAELASDPYCERTGQHPPRRQLPRRVCTLFEEEFRNDYFRAAIRANDGDVAHIVEHLRPIITSARESDRLDWAVLRNGLGHGEESNEIFWEEFEIATTRWWRAHGTT